MSLFFRVNGGVSKNDFVMQSLADSTGLEVERPVSVEMSILGVAFLAGLQCGMKKISFIIVINYLYFIFSNFSKNLLEIYYNIYIIFFLCKIPDSYESLCCTIFDSYIT